MAITWFRTRTPGRHATGHAAAPAAELAQPRGLHAAPAAPDYDTSYDHPGWDEAERELLMPAAPGPAPAGPPWAADEGILSERTRTALRTMGLKGPDLAEVTLTDKPLDVLRPEAAPERAEPGPDLAAAPQDRPYIPQDSGLPSVWLRAIPQSGPGGRVLETLTGMPFFAGIRHDPGGGRTGGLCWGAADDIWLVADIKSVEVADAALAALRELRENLAYGAFRAPAVQPDPDAAGHREALERELDAIEAEEAEGETARAVLQAAGNLGFISGDLKRDNAEGVLNVLVSRADLARAIGREDGPAALKAAEDLVDGVSELCGDEVACALANGLAPADEAASETGAASEAAAADGPEPVGVPEDGTADGQDGTAAA